MYALDASDGTEQSRFQIGSSASTTPTVANDTLYVGSSNGNIYVLNVNNGTERWRYETDNYVFASPAVTNTSVYVGFGGRLYALENH